MKDLSLHNVTSLQVGKFTFRADFDSSNLARVQNPPTGAPTVRIPAVRVLHLFVDGFIDHYVEHMNFQLERKISTPA